MTVRNYEGMRRDGGRMYSDTLGKKHYDNKQTKPKREKVVTPPTKVVVRYLPATMTEEEFQEAVSPLPENDYFCFMNADLSLAPNAYCRAYINFKNVEDVFIFRDKFDGYVFVDQKGNEYPAMVEFAPFQKIPKRLIAKKKDARCSTIDNDPDYLTFLELLNNPEPVNLPAMEAVLEEIEAHDRELQANNGFIKVKTPLLEFIEQKKAEKLRSKEERKEERRRKEFERKKAREDDRRKRKDYRDPRKKDDYRDERKKDDYRDERRKDDYRDERKKDDYRDERKKDDYRDERKKDDYRDERKKDDYRDERKKDDYKDERKKDDYKDERKKDDSKDDTSPKPKMNIMHDEQKEEKIIEEKLEKLSLRIENEEKERGKTEKIIESKIEKLSSRIEKDKERIEIEKERQRKSEEIRLEARRQRDRDSDFRREKDKKNRKQVDDENEKLKDEDDVEGKLEKVARMDKERERLEREKERQKRTEEIRLESRKLREKERERREKERQLRKEKEREERLKRQEEKAKIRAEEKTRYKDEYRDDYYEEKYYNTSSVKAEGAKTKRYSEGRRKEERERRLKEEREREKRMREADVETESLEGKSNESLNIPKEEKHDKSEDNISEDKNDCVVEENKSNVDCSTMQGSDGNKSGSEGNKSAGEGSKYEGDDNKSGSEGNTVSKDGADKQDDDDKRRKDLRAVRRIRNKDRPTMALYRPGQSRLAQSRMGKSRDDNQDGGETSSSSPSPVMPSGDCKKEGTKDTKDSKVKSDIRNKDDEDKKSVKAGKVGTNKVIKYPESRIEDERDDDYDDRKSPDGDELEDGNKDTETKKYGQKIFRRSVSRE